MRGHTRLFAACVTALAAMGSSFAGVLVSPAAADLEYTSWFMRSEPGDYVGRGKTWSYYPNSAYFPAEGDAEQVTLTLSLIDGRLWTAKFAAPEGELLVAGSSFPAMRDPALAGPGVAAMDVFGSGRGCNNGSGEFTVDQAAYDETGAVTRFAVHFEQHCDIDGDALLGSIAVKALDPAYTLPPAPAEPVMWLSAVAGLNSAVLSWTNPGEDRYVTTKVRVARGSVPPATPSDGARVYTGRGDQLVLTDLYQDQDFAISVFTTGADGSVAGPVSTQLYGTRLSLVDDQYPGLGRKLRIRLTDTAGEGVGNASVDLYQRNPDSDRWRRVSGWTTHGNGRAKRDWVTYRDHWYRAVFNGAGSHLGTVSSDLFVRGEPRPSASR